MKKTEILIVEDEWMIAEYLKTTLQKLGYSVSAMAASGEDAIRIAMEMRPALILMDIVLTGEIDGIEAARVINEGQSIPIIFLSAYAEVDMVEKARQAGVYGYLVKPVKESELKATIDLALYKHNMEQQLKDSENRLFATLRSINDAVISTDENGCITFMNSLAGALTGWDIEDAKGKLLKDIFDIREDDLTLDKGTCSETLIQERLVCEQRKYLLKTKDTWDMHIELSSAPMADDRGNIGGMVIAFRDITKRIHTDKELEKYRTHLEDIVKDRTVDLRTINERFLKEIAERILIEEKMDASLKEKDVMMDEINHRVGNNLQVIYGMLNMQMDYMQDKHSIEVFRGCQNRIMSMALVHDILYKSRDLAHIDFKDYVSRLSRSLFSSYGVSHERVVLKMDIEKVSISIDTAITSGLIINEILSNSLMHAFPGGAKGKVWIHLRAKSDDSFELTIGDNGIGLPEGFDFRNTETFGLKTITSYENSKSWGRFDLNTTGGTEYRVYFKDSSRESPLSKSLRDSLELKKNE